MPASTAKLKTLRPYQDALFLDIIGSLSEGVRDLLLHAPPASGKTLMTWAVVAKAMRDGLFDLVLVVSPTGQIREQWEKSAEIDACGERLTYSAAEVQPRQVKELAFWRGHGVFTACHAGALSAKVGEFLKRERPDLRTCLVVVDEAHHASTVNVSGETLDTLLELGAAVLRSTGTPWHREGRVASARSGTPPRTLGLSAGCLARQRDEDGHPYAPQHWIALQEQVKFRTDDVSLAVDEGRERANVEPTEYRDLTLKAMILRWVTDGCPKAVFNLPRVEWAKADKVGLVALLTKSRKVRAVLGRAPRICDLTGDQTGAERLDLDHDREAKRWQDCRIDVVLSCHRANEGMDWKWCSDVYNVGVPGSLVLLIQRWCRASRSKVGLVGYPRTRVPTGDARRVTLPDVQRMTFFVPILTEDAQDRLWHLHHDHAILAACMLECYEIGLQWASSVERPDEFGQSYVGRADDTRTAARLRAAADILIDEAESQGSPEQAAAYAELMRYLPADGGGITGAALGEIVNRLVMQRSPDDAITLITAADMLMARSSSDGLQSTTKARERRRREAATLAAQGKSPAFIRSAIRASKIAAFREFVRLHAANLVASIPEGVRRNAVVFTGYDTERLGSALRDLTPPPWYGMNLAQLQAFTRVAAERYTGRTGKRPANGHGACVELGGFTWAGLDLALHNFGSSTLASVIGYARPTCDDMAIEIVEWFRAHGRWPRRGATDPEEKRLGCRLVHIRQSAPECCAKYGIPLRADQSEVVRRAHGKHQFRTLSEVTIACAVHGNPSLHTDQIGSETGNNLNKLLGNATSKPGQSRGLSSAPDLCQVNSLAKLTAEVRADCWEFTLDGASEPDPRSWAELLASGDHKRIVSARRTHFLDWQDTRLRGGTRWTDERTCCGPKVPDAVRRKWTPPA